MSDLYQFNPNSSTYLFPSPHGQPVLIEYRDLRTVQDRFGVIYVCRGETLMDFREKITDLAGDRLFDTHEVFTELKGLAADDFYVIWSSGDSVHVRSQIRNDDEFKACLRLMERRGWRDRFLACSARAQGL
jgi:hypothetical protein